MCISPITIDNPYYKLGGKGYLKYKDRYKEISFGQYNKLHNTRDSKIKVPCGKCAQCLSNRQNFVNQRIQMESIRSHLFMLTLTYQDSELMHTNCGEYKVAYPYYKDIQNCFKSMRKAGFSFRYYVISEYGKKGRPHFHAIIAIEKSPDWKGDFYEPRSLEFRYGKAFLKYWRRNYNDNWNPVYKDLLRYVVGRDGRSTFDFHYIEPIPGHDSDCAFYVSKYLWKYDKRIESLLAKIRLDPNLDNEQVAYLTSCIKPRSAMSKDFGSWKLDSTSEYINNCLSRNNDIPQFYDLHSGKGSLLAPYYRNHLVSVDWKLNQFDRLSIAKDFDSFEIANSETPLENIVSAEKKINISNHTQLVKDLLYSKY